MIRRQIDWNAWIVYAFDFLVGPHMELFMMIGGQSCGLKEKVMCDDLVSLILIPHLLNQGIRMFSESELTNWDIGSVKDVEKWGDIATLRNASLNFMIDPFRNVTHCFCECPAGAGNKSKHIAALVYYINNEESNSKTNVEQEWGKPSKSGEAKYKKGRTIEYLYPKKKQHYSKSESNTTNRTISHKALVNECKILEIPCILSKMIEKEIQSEADIECQRCLLDLLNEVEKSVDIDFLNFILTKQNAYDIALLPMIGSYFPLNLNENKFYMNNIVVDL
ncbi:hypothetical protein QTP88_026689 [Uroleucon formosanum]